MRKLNAKSHFEIGRVNKPLNSLKKRQAEQRSTAAPVCQSCRAFWRRCCQKTQKPPLKCVKKTNDCVISVSNRRECQKCRYDRCIAAGMTTGAGSAETKRVQKRQRQQDQEPLPDSTPSAGGGVDPTKVDFALRR